MLSRAMFRLLPVLALTCSLTKAAVVYDETLMGDLSNSGLAPTVITVVEGSNQINGATGRQTGVDRDYFTFTVPTGLTLAAITPLAGTTVAANSAFIGLQAGNQVTLPTNASSAAGLLGWWHYTPDDIGVNILNSMAAPAAGSSGFSVPLPSGSYSVWIQEFGAGVYPYHFDVVLAPADVPEPGTWVSACLGFAVLAATRLRRRKGQ